MTPTPFTSAAITSLCRTVILTQRSLALGTGIEGGRYGSDTRNGNCQVLGSQVSVILATYVTAFLRH